MLRFDRIAAFGLLAAFVSQAWAQSPEASVERGAALYNQERWQDAIDAFKDAIARKPDSAPIQYNLGTALARDKRFGEAAVELAKAARATDPVSGDAWYNLGVASADKVALEHPQVFDFLKKYPAKDDPLPEKELAKLKPEEIDKSIKGLLEASQSMRQLLMDHPGDMEGKFNFEVAKQMIDRLRQMKKQQEENQQKQQQDQNQDQQNQDKQDQQDKQQQKPNDQQDQQGQGQPKQNNQDQGMEKPAPTATPTPAPSPSPQPQDQSQDGKDQQNQPPPPQPGQPGEAKPLTSDQMDALRLLQLLEGDKPEQFKNLFKFQGKPREDGSRKKW